MAILWRDIPGQERAKGALSRSFEKEQLGHAYLFAGAAGVGKFSTALQLAMSLFCEAEHKPCFSCTACKRVLNHSHPDFRYLFPVRFDPAHRAKSGKKELNEEGWEYIATRAKQKLNSPFLLSADYGEAIPVDWIREVNRTIQRGPTEAKHAVVIMEGIEHFRSEALNAMLKTLEEPPPNTVIILLARGIHAVLPTVLSRCQIFRFSLCDSALLRQELSQRFPAATEEQRELALFRGKGSPGETFACLSDEEDAAFRLTQMLIARLSTAASRFAHSKELELFVMEHIGRDFGLAAEVVETFLEEIRLRFLAPLSARENYFLGSAVVTLPPLTSEQAVLLVEICQDALLSIKRHSSLLFVFIELELRVLDCIHGK